MRAGGRAVSGVVFVLTLMHFATVEHQDNQADDKGTGQFEGACPIRAMKQNAQPGRSKSG